ncbi:hypothetical protein VTN00DRAFT_9297 [Thermoascus crustaceus]|uniref:uncharacterized protein n=1 Tax=Thermoascus crustaceus TaxID=5088 RepID=UPI003743375A
MATISKPGHNWSISPGEIVPITFYVYRLPEGISCATGGGKIYSYCLKKRLGSTFPAYHLKFQALPTPHTVPT